MATAMKRQNLRRNMEGQKGGGGEVRRVHVLYFLSRNGAIEQPHLIRVHHLHRTGVHLRDVKRWLSDLRGKDMPDSYAWSYKRRYKSGYVWQDLMDDDLITPISDNEYVLKGSEISPKSDLHPLDTSSNDDEDEAAKHAPNLEHSPLLLIQVETDKGLSPKSPPDPDQDSPGAPPPPSCSEGSDEYAKCASKIINGHLWDEQVELKKADSKEENEHAKEKEEWRSLDGNHKNRSNGCNTTNWWSGRKTSNLFRNLFRCHEAETNDASLFKIQRRERYQSMSGGSYRRGTVADIFGDENVGNRRSFANDSR